MSALRDEVLDYLASHNVMTLATTGPAGPWAAAVFYVNDGFKLSFLSSPSTRHAVDIAMAGRCAAAIHEDYRDWKEIKGIQLEGSVRAITGQEKVKTMARYAHKFPVIRLDRAPDVVRAALDRIGWYELAVERCFFVDNSKGFAHREEVPIS